MTTNFSKIGLHAPSSPQGNMLENFDLGTILMYFASLYLPELVALTDNNDGAHLQKAK
jgi:hypothetical protein